MTLVHEERSADTTSMNQVVVSELHVVPDGALTVADVDAVLALIEREEINLAIATLRSIRAALMASELPGSVARVPAGGVTLTTREGQILRCLSDGAMSQKDVARRLGVTRNTVKTHLKAAYLKLGAHSRSEAVQLARECGLLAPNLQIVQSAEGRDGAGPTLMPHYRAEGSARRSA